MLSSKHVGLLIIRPVLEHLGMGGANAEQLVLGTALQESKLTFLHQTGAGPAIGLWQMEPATYNDIWANYLHFRPELADKVEALMPRKPVGSDALAGNLYLAAAMCRIRYARVAEAIPDPWNIIPHSKYWKGYYNTPQGAGTIEEYQRNASPAYSPGTWQ